MIIKLPWIDPFDTLNLPENFEEQVKESFRHFTEGTSKNYRFEDKLLYLDNLRGFLHPVQPDEAVRDLIGDCVKQQLEEYGEIPSAEEILSVEFMEDCYRAGFKPLRDQYEKYSSSANERTLKAIMKMIQIIANYEEEAQE